MAKQTKVFNPGHKWTTQVNSLDLNNIDKWVLHLICTYWCIFIPIEAKGMNSAKNIQAKLGYLLSKEEMIDSLKRLTSFGYIKGKEKSKQFGAAKITFDVNSFAIQSAFESEAPDIEYKNILGTINGEESPF